MADWQTLDRTFRFPSLSPAEFWALIANTHEFVDWWGWLHSLDGGELRTGATTEIVVRPYVPYEVVERLVVTEVTPGRTVRVTVGGDYSGWAGIDIADAPDGGSDVRMQWDLTVNRRSLRILLRILGPLVDAGHEALLDRGCAAFERRAVAQSRSTNLGPTRR